MTRTQAIATVQSTIGTLSDDRVQLLADMVQSWSKPTVYSSLPDPDRAELDAAIDSVERGEAISWTSAQAELEKKLKAAGV